MSEPAEGSQGSSVDEQTVTYIVQEQVDGESPDPEGTALHEVDEVVDDLVVVEVVLAGDELVECAVREDEV